MTDDGVRRRDALPPAADNAANSEQQAMRSTASGTVKVMRPLTPLPPSVRKDDGLDRGEGPKDVVRRKQAAAKPARPQRPTDAELSREKTAREVVRKKGENAAQNKAQNTAGSDAARAPEVPAQGRKPRVKTGADGRPQLRVVEGSAGRRQGGRR
jgi:hypothetical protein